jgi:hypothetical protein
MAVNRRRQVDGGNADEDEAGGGEAGPVAVF